MAYNIKDVFFLDATIETTTGAGRGITLMDISSYVQPVVRKGIKPTGLAIYKVHWYTWLAGIVQYYPQQLAYSVPLSFQI